MPQSGFKLGPVTFYGNLMLLFRMRGSNVYLLTPISHVSVVSEGPYAPLSFLLCAVESLRIDVGITQLLSADSSF